MKTNKMKKLITLSAATCMAVVGGVALMGNTEATTPVFDMSGASIRYKASADVNDNGIRFGVYANDAMYEQFSTDDNAVVGTLIIPTDLLAGETLALGNEDAINVVTWGNQVVEEENVKVTTWRENEDGDMETIVYLTGMPATSYNRALTSVGYIDWDGDGENVQYTTDSVNLSIADVALATIAKPETTATQKTELNGYINNYTVKFTDDYGVATKETVAYGSEFTTTPATLENRTGYNFLGWYERTGASTYAETATDFETASKVVKGNREFVAKFAQTGKTFSKPGIQSTSQLVFGGADNVRSYADGNYTIHNSGWTYNDTIANDGTAFVTYATIQPTTATEVGFVLKANADRYVEIVYRKASNDIFVWGQGTDGGKFLSFPLMNAVDIFGAEDDQASTMALVYRDGCYYVTIDGTIVAYVGENDARNDNGSGGYYNGRTIKYILAPDANLSIGIASHNATTVFTDWGYSTDTAVMDSYVITLSETINTHWNKPNAGLQSKRPTRTGYKLVGNADVPAAYLFNGVEIAQGIDYMVEMSVAGGYGSNQGIGFVVGTLGDKCVNNMHIQWNGDANGSGATASGYFNVGRYADRAADRNFGGLYNDNWGAARGCPTTIARTGAAMTMTLVYKADVATYYVFINGEKALEFYDRTPFGNSEAGIGNVGQLVGVGQQATIKIGVSLLIGELNITKLGYSTNAQDIAKFFPVVEE